MELFLTSRKRADLPFQQDVLPEDMSLAVVQRALDIGATAPDIPVLLTGNEPLLHPDLEDVFTAIRKRKLNCITEVSGLMPDSAKKLLLEHPCTLFWRLYRPELLAPGDLAEIRVNLKELRDARVPIQFLLMADDLDASYDFALKWLEEFQVRSLLVHMSCSAPIPQRVKLAAWCADQAVALLKRGHTLSLDCGAMPCLFSDEQFGLHALKQIRFAGLPSYSNQKYCTIHVRLVIEYLQKNDLPQNNPVKHLLAVHNKELDFSYQCH